MLDGVAVTGWFAEDFTLAQLRTLRAVERLPGVRPQNTAFNGLYRIPTLDEVLDLARHSRTCDGRPVGVYPETKHPTYFDDQGLSLEEPLLETLAANGYDADDPVFIQSFETTNLRQLDEVTDFSLVQLADCAGAPVRPQERRRPDEVRRPRHARWSRGGRVVRRRPRSRARPW